jgi:predicted PurR-regulated permease PerM
MPRWLASLLVVAGVLAFMALFIATLLPLLVNQVLSLIDRAPTTAQIQHSVAQVDQSFAHLPLALRTALRQIINDLGTSFRAQIDKFILALPLATAQAVLGIFNALGTLLGLLVLPTWLLVVLKDGKQGVREINKLLAPRVRLDFWSLVRIVDRSLRAFLQQQVTQSFLVGAAMGLVLWGLDRVGLADVKFPFAGGLIVGTLNLIPVIGSILVYILLVITGLAQGPQVVLALAVAYFLVNRFAGQYVNARVATHVKQPHNAVMALLAIMLSQVGFVYAALSVPIIVLSRDVFRYVYGRLSDPQRPAGLLPDDPNPIAPPDQQVLVTARKPLVYRRVAVKRRPPTQSGVS